MTKDDETSTLSHRAKRRRSDAPTESAYLFLVLDARWPASQPVRLQLDGLEDITIGRGAARTFELSEDGRRLAIRTDDRWLSSQHARLTRVFDRWVLEDLESKNGSLVNGADALRTELSDGDLLELGRSVFIFRAALSVRAGAPVVVEGPRGEAGAAGLTTLLPALERAYAELATLAPSGLSILLEGETGTGKEVVSRAIHALSGRRGAFVAVNCGALPSDLVVAELSGHQKGSFSGATEDRIGLVRAADGGTLFLDEIGDLPLPSQAALLRILQESEVRPVGATKPIRVDLRVVAATHRDLGAMVESGGFRADLLARLAGHRARLAPLRERREDLGALASAVVRARLEGSATRPKPLDDEAARALVGYTWPGNVRELEKALESATLLAAGADAIALEHLPSPVRRGAVEPTDAHREELIALLTEHKGNIAAVARASGKARMQVQRWLKRYDLQVERFRSS